MHDDYSRLLLPETTEIAFATICGEIERHGGRQAQEGTRPCSCEGHRRGR
jgi:hypothetical protein